MSQQVDQLVTGFFQKVVRQEPVHVAFTPEDVVREGKRRHWQFRLIAHHGTIDEPYEDEEFEYSDLETLRGEYTLPGWANKRLKFVRSQFPIKQVIIGHEKDNPLDAAEEAVRRRTEETKKAIRRLAVAVAGILGMVAVAASMLVLLAVGAVILAGAAVVAAPVALLDPMVIVVLDNPEESWVCIARYLE